VTISIAPFGKDACEHPYLIREQLEKLDHGEKLLAGEFNLMVYTEVASFMSDKPWVEIDSAIGSFSEMTASRISSVNLDSIPLGSCVSWRSNGQTPGYWLEPYFNDSADGGKLTLTGPGFADAPLDDDDDWYYGLLSVRRVSDSQLLSGDGRYVYTPGEYLLHGTGGFHVAAFNSGVQLPEFLSWTNKDNIGFVNRNAPPEVSWTGASPTDRIIVEGVLAVMTGGDIIAPELDVGSFICAVQQASKSFKLPVEVVRLLPIPGNFPSAGALTVAALRTVRGQLSRPHY
jgi:hypothetical protein